MIPATYVPLVMIIIVLWVLALLMILRVIEEQADRIIEEIRRLHK